MNEGKNEGILQNDSILRCSTLWIFSAGPLGPVILIGLVLRQKIIVLKVKCVISAVLNLMALNRIGKIMTN